jgi:hypothetical protein
MPTIVLSDDAVALLRRRLKGDLAEVTDDTREAYRELARAGIMIPLHSFTRGDGALYRFTEEGWERRFEFTSASPAGFAVRLRRWAAGFPARLSAQLHAIRFRTRPVRGR